MWNQTCKRWEGPGGSAFSWSVPYSRVTQDHPVPDARQRQTACYMFGKSWDWENLRRHRRHIWHRRIEMDRTERCTRRELRYLHSMKSFPSTFPAFEEHTLYWGTRLRNKQWQQSNNGTVWMVILTSRILLAGKWSPDLTKFTQRVCVRRRPKNPACYFPSQCLIYYLLPKGMKV